MNNLSVFRVATLRAEPSNIQFSEMKQDERRSAAVISSSNSDNLVNFTAGTKTVFCTYPAKRAPSASMTASTYVNTHSSTISDTQTMESGVLAGPVTVSGNVTVTGTLVII